MTQPIEPGDPERADAFIQAADRPTGGVSREVFRFLMQTKKWWLLPIVLALVLVGAIAVLGGSGAAPFIYTLF
jgi:hypothetical protein